MRCAWGQWSSSSRQAAAPARRMRPKASAPSDAAARASISRRAVASNKWQVPGIPRFYTWAMSRPATRSDPDHAALALRIRAHVRDWLAQGLYGSMDWMARHGDKRARPDDLVPGTLRVISVGLDYGRRDDEEAWGTLADGERAYVARYALGRDYHKLMRQRLQKLADRIAEEVGPFGHRVFVDSAPVLERALARNAGLGWIGKHTCLIDRDGGSWFFLGEIYVDLPLPVDVPATAHCGTCTRC